MQVAVVKEKEKEEAAAISEEQAIERAILHSIARHRISPSSILAVDVIDRGWGCFEVRIYLKGNVVAVYADVEKQSGKVCSRIVELIPDPGY